MAKTPAVIVVDQDIDARFEVKQAVRASSLTLAGECGFGVEALSTANETRPDGILVGVNEPMERSLQTIESLISLRAETPVIVYSSAKEIEVVRATMLAGARDFLQRPVRPEALKDSVLKALASEENRRLRKTGQINDTPTVGTVITVFGAKGGIGKSTVATNLGVALSQLSTDAVVIVDLDNSFGDIAGMLDVKPERSLFNLAHEVESVERDDLKRFVVKHPSSGLDVLSGPTLLEWRKLSGDSVRAVIELLQRSYDKIVLDTSGTLNEISEVAMQVATIVLWVTTSEYSSVRDSIEAMRSLRALSYSHERMRIVINGIYPDDAIRPSAVQEALQRDIFWQIPYDRKVRTGTHLGQPIVITSPQSVVSKSFVELATVISGGKVNRNGKAFGGFKWRGSVQRVAAEGS